MQVGVAPRLALRQGFLLVAITIVALIISAALAHLVPLQSVDGASHVASITNPASGSAADTPGVGDNAPVPAHHEHFEIDHDGTVAPRTVDSVGTIADAPPAALYALVGPSERDLSPALFSNRVLRGPSLTALSISRT